MILSDSLSVLLSLESTKLPIHVNPHILKVKEKYNQYTKNNPNNSIKFCWIPSHMGIQGNETADELAKEATKTPATESTLLPYTDLFHKFKKEANDRTKVFLEHTALTKGVTFFKFYRHMQSRPWYIDKKLNRKCIVTMNRCRANHYNLNASLARVNIVPQANCECDFEIQDLDHILWQCTLFDDQRKKFIDKLHKNNMQLLLNAGTLIAKPTATICNILCNFLDECHLQL